MKNGFLFILFVVLVHYCRTTIAQGRCSPIDPYCVSPFDPSPVSKAVLPDSEVNAIRTLLKSSEKPWDVQNKKFSASDCHVRTEVNCTCNYTTNICHITAISCSDHELSGRIPEEIGNLSYLQAIDFRGNMFSGGIPTTLTKLTNLQYLNLEDNFLEGPIPPFLGNMTGLIQIAFTRNWFNGSIPETLSNISSLTFLDLGTNRLSGKIPYQLGSITKLWRLKLNDNQLSDPLPPQLGDLKTLYVLALEDNQLSGGLPSSFMKLTNLGYVNLRGNNFVGKVPDYIGGWKNLYVLRLMGNKFDGPLPSAISSLGNLVDLAVSDLMDGSGVERGFPFPDVSGMTELQYLTLRNCTITDGIPGYIVNMKMLYYLDLSFNRLTGEIPSVSLQQSCLQNLKYLFLRGNTLNGSFPEWLTKSINYSYVDVSENNFTSLTRLPVHLSKNLNMFECCSNTPNLTEKWQANHYTCQNKTKYRDLLINCGGEETEINGTYYKADVQPNGGSTFFLSDDGSWGYSSMGTFYYADEDLYLANRTCNMSMAESSLYETARLAPISLKYFGFCLDNGNYTVKLHFAEIVWNPIRGLDSKARRVFDVAIQGKKVLSNFNIEEAAGGVNKDTTKEFPNTIVNNSRLEIHLYWTGIGSMYKPTMYYGPLISAISAKHVQKKHNRLSPLAISGIVGASLLFPLLVLFLLWKWGYFGVKDPEYEELKAELPGKFFNFQQIKVATENFSVNNKLGEGGFGSVYKGILSDGTAIAVKQFSAKSRQGIREFVNEIGTVSALQHPNLVKLLGCCAEDSQRLLIYEYMENNSLEYALFGSEELKPRLNWATRVQICRGIAKGLAFLHEESELKVVHRDIKPTNILLDKDLTAKISDFGFAKLYEGEDSHIVTRIAGTTGYMAPEYAMRGHLTYKADVYSFGVVLLEIFSGKNSASYLPNDQSVYLLDLACVLQKEGNLIDLVDPALKDDDYTWDEANKILNLALLCTDRSYTLRPKMSEVVKILEGEKNIDNYTVGEHYSMDDSAMAKVIAGLSQSTQSGSSSRARISDNTLTRPAAKETEGSTISPSNASEVVNENGGTSGKDKSST